MMKHVSTFKMLHWTMLSKPACDRAIYRAIKKLQARSIVEIGLEDGARAERIVQVAQKFGAGQTVKYTGIDLFDGRPDGQTELTLLGMHKRLSALGVKPQLVPGGFVSSIRRIANSNTRTDLMVVSACVDRGALEESWRYIPRMLCAGSFVMVQSEAEGAFRMLTRHEIERMSEENSHVKREAA